MIEAPTITDATITDATITKTEEAVQEQKEQGKPLASKGELVPLRVMGGKRWFTVVKVTIDGVVFQGNTTGIESEAFAFVWKGYEWVAQTVENEGFLALPFQRTLSNDRRRNIRSKKYIRRGRISKA